MAKPKTQSSKLKTNKPESRHKVFLRWLLPGLILIAVLCLVLAWMWRALPQIAIKEIIELTNTKIDAKSVDLNFDGSVFIEKLVIRPEQEQEHDNSILKAKTVYAHFSTVSLLLLRPRLKEIHINDFVFDAQLDLDTGRWNLAALKLDFPSRGSGTMPLVSLNKGTLQYSKVSKGQVEVAAAIPVDATFGFDEKTQDGYKFSITTAELTGGFGKSNLGGFWKPGRVTIAGGISSKDIPSFERTGAIDIMAAELNYNKDNSYSLKLRISDLHSTHSPKAETLELVKPVFSEKAGPFTALQKFFARYRPVGTVDIDLEMAGNFGQLSESKVAGKVYCNDVSICDRNFTYTIGHLAGQVDFTENTAVMNKLSGKHGNVDVIIDGWTSNFGPNKQYQISVISNNMALDDDLYNALSARQKKLWDAFSPSGLVAVDYRLIRKSQTDKQKTLAIELLNTDAAYKHFPYPLKNLTGKLFFSPDSITVSDVLSQINGSKISFNGEVTEFNTDRPIYSLSIKADNIPLDTTLEAALPTQHKNIYNQFDMSGFADAEVKVFTPKQDSEPATFLADVYFKKTALKVNKTPLAVSGISAKAVISADSMSIESFSGQCSQGLVSLVGEIRYSNDAQPYSYHWTVDVKQTQLNDDFIGLLPTSLQKVVSEMQPQGKVNFSADLNRTGRDQLDYKLVVDCLGDSLNLGRFAYPLKDITGRVTIQNDSIILENITAVPADNTQPIQETPTIKVNGKINLADNAFRDGQFKLSASDISLNERLGATLPEEAAALYQQLSPKGKFDLDLENVKIFNSDDGEKYIDFTGIAKLKACNFSMPGAEAELDAVLKTNGLYKTNGDFAYGQVNLVADTFRIKGKSLTNLKADFNYNQRLQAWLTEELLADFYGGKLIGKFQFKQPTEQAWGYLLQAAFDNVDLRRFLSDTKLAGTTEKDYTSGTMNGSLSIDARIGDEIRRTGRCRLAISNMQVGKVSPLAKMLQVLTTEPTDFEFEQMLVDSYIKHDRLFLEKFDLSGESLAFHGSGWIDLSGENVDLILTARGRRLAATEPSVLQSLTEGLGGAVVRVEVTGNIYDPNVETKTLPVIGDTLEILGTKPTESKP